MSNHRVSRLTINGVGLDCRWVGPGPGQAPTMVLLHEGLGSAQQWGTWPESLAEATGCGVFLYSRAGYGTSDPIALPRRLDYLEDEAVRVLPQVLAAVGFERGILLGHSDGASIATCYLGRVGDHRVRGLILLAPHFYVEPVGLQGVEAARVAFETGDLRTWLAKHHGANVDLAFWGWNNAWLDPAFQSWDIREAIGFVRVPILIVQGTADPYGTTAQIDAALAEAYCPVETVLLEGVGHAPHLERHRETLEAVARFTMTLMTTLGEGGRHGR